MSIKSKFDAAKFLANLIFKKQIQKQKGIMKILPGDKVDAEKKAEAALKKLEERGNININNLKESDLEFIAEDIVNPFKYAEKTPIKSADILPFRFKRSFAEELADASKKGDFTRMSGIMKLDPKFKEVMKVFNKSKADEKAYEEMVGPKRLIPHRDVIPYQSPEVQKLSPKEKLARTTLTEDQYKDVLKKGYGIDDVIYAQDFYGDTAEDVIRRAAEKGTPVAFADGGVAGLLGERQNFAGGKLAQKLTQEIIRKYKGRVDDRLLNQMLADDNPQRLAEVMATIDEALIMQNKGMGPDEIVGTIKSSLDRKKQAEGGITRVPFAMGRRAFLKLMGGVGAGIGALKAGALSMFGKGTGKQAAKEVVKDVATTSSPPPYFFNLVNKIKTLGDDTLATKDKVIAKKYKDYVMEEDFAGNIEIMKKGGDDMFPEDVYMSYKVDEVPIKGKKGSTKVEEYEEFTARPDMEGKMKDVEEGVPDEVVEEGTMFEDNITDFGKASGGLARMLGE